MFWLCLGITIISWLIGVGVGVSLMQSYGQLRELSPNTIKILKLMDNWEIWYYSDEDIYTLSYKIHIRYNCNPYHGVMGLCYVYIDSLRIDLPHYDLRILCKKAKEIAEKIKTKRQNEIFDSISNNITPPEGGTGAKH